MGNMRNNPKNQIPRQWFHVRSRLLTTLAISIMGLAVLIAVDGTPHAAITAGALATFAKSVSAHGQNMIHALACLSVLSVFIYTVGKMQTKRTVAGRNRISPRPVRQPAPSLVIHVLHSHRG
jgi:hypothetical protein